MTKKRKKYHVFLSHNSVDRPWVNRLKDALEARRLKVWLDQDEIRPGDLFVDALEKGLESSRTVALIVSPEAMRSGWVKEEYNRALNLAQDKNEPLRLIPVILHQAELPGFLSGRNWVDFTNQASFDESIKKLIWGITGKRSRSAPSVPPLRNKAIKKVSIYEERQTKRQPDKEGHQAQIGLTNDREGTDESVPPNERQHYSWISEVYDAVQESKAVFEGIGDIDQSHYDQAVAALEKMQTCIQDLLEQLNTFTHLPESLDREQLIVELRHMEVEVTQSISHVGKYDAFRSYQQDRNRKDTDSRLAKALEVLDKINRHIHWRTDTS